MKGMNMDTEKLKGRVVTVAIGDDLNSLLEQAQGRLMSEYGMDMNRSDTIRYLLKQAIAKVLA